MCKYFYKKLSLGLVVGTGCVHSVMGLSIVVFPACIPDFGYVYDLNGEQVGTTDILCNPDCPLQSVLVLFGGHPKPDIDGCADNRL